MSPASMIDLVLRQAPAVPNGLPTAIPSGLPTVIPNGVPTAVNGFPAATSIASAPGAIQSNINNVQNTFSSWDSCMSQTYCKYPAIIGIALGSLFLLSIIFCIARCCCCGVECCCACCSCFNACCPSPRKRSQRHDGPPAPPPNHFAPAPYQGYQQTPAPLYSPVHPPAPLYSPVHPPAARPQYAHFDSHSKQAINEDALPSMPSWETASSRRVLDDAKDDDMEMNRLDPAKEQSAALLAHKAPSSHAEYHDTSPNLAYQQHGNQQGGDLGAPYGDHASIAAYASQRQQTQSPYSVPANQNSYGAPAYNNNQRPYGASSTSPIARPYQSAPMQPQNSYGVAAPYPQGSSYSAYAPSGSTRYEPTGTYGGQETGIAQAAPPIALQPGVSRKPIQNTWREV